MSLNWVMLSPNTADPFVKLPHEKILYTSPTRTSLELASANPAKKYSVKSDGGVAYVTNQRIVYLPSKPTEELSSFNAPILSLQDTYVRAPFFGANYWAAVVKPTPGGGIPSEHPILELKLTFREGGAFDWHGVFEQIKERLYYARQAAQESGRPLDPTGEVNLEQLPAYEAATEVHEDDGRPPAFQSSPDSNEISTATVPNGSARARPDSFQPPDEPPPGYEEAQAQAVEVTFEERDRRRVEMGGEGDEETESTVSRSPELSRASRQSLSEVRAGGRPSG